VKRTMLERRIMVPLLVTYVVVLALAAWRHEIRPRAFDRATDIAGSTLAFAGILPGVAVFTADKGGGPDEKIAAICLEVRGVSKGVSEGELKEKKEHQVYPEPDTVCPAPQPRLWVRGEQIFLGRSVVSLRATAAARRAGDNDPARTRFGMLLAKSIGAHFVARGHLVGTAAERYLLLWREARISYRTGSRSDRVVALLNWRDAPAPQVFVAWRPNATTLRERGWGSAEP
jgi:hypothetical protein